MDEISISVETVREDWSLWGLSAGQKNRWRPDKLYRWDSNLQSGKCLETDKRKATVFIYIYILNRPTEIRGEI